MSRRRPLSSEEKILWRRVTKDVAPIEGAVSVDKTDISPSVITEKNSGDAGVVRPDRLTTSSFSKASKTKTDQKTSKPVASRAVDARAKKPLLPKKATMGAPTAWRAGDPRRDKLAANRRLPIDRTLDLHGLTQVEAETLLISFVKAAHADGCRCLLIITGKGGPASTSNMMRARAARSRRDDPPGQGTWIDTRKHGVLRERVRDWVDGPALRHLVSRLSTARPKDGGNGAYYLHLKA